MRVKFRIALYNREGKRLSKEEFIKSSSALYRGMRYITEFKYLEATKWLMLAQDSKEKYLLLGLLNIALGQESEGLEFLREASKHPPTTDYKIAIENPEENLRVFIEKTEASLPDFLLSL
ncbi:MAG: hypothetical protein ACK4LA_04355 [Aquificaceae bacterium]